MITGYSFARSFNATTLLQTGVAGINKNSARYTNRECLCAIRNLEINVDQWNVITSYNYKKKMDSVSHTLYEHWASSPWKIKGNFKPWTLLWIFWYFSFNPSNRATTSTQRPAFCQEREEPKPVSSDRNSTTAKKVRASSTASSSSSSVYYAGPNIEDFKQAMDRALGEEARLGGSLRNSNKMRITPMKIKVKFAGFKTESNFIILKLVSFNPLIFFNFSINNLNF